MSTQQSAQLKWLGISCRLGLSSEHLRSPCFELYPNLLRFPKYKPKNNKFSIWTESYGGHWGPTFADYFQSQNSKIASGSLPKSAVALNIETLGIINGCIDASTQIPLYPVMAYNNTYGIQVINKTEFDFGMQSWPACKKLIDSCQSLATQKDPAATGANADVNGACATAFDSCFKTMHDVYLLKNVSLPATIQYARSALTATSTA